MDMKNNMYRSHIINISNTGNIIVPKFIREHLGSDCITFEINEGGQVTISPVESIGGVFANDGEGMI